ncbi:MAG TPA: GNAT family N-acetyltransferase [Myxococcota bacterium]|nr:GNAT family N-acetyltransferase [Myxococcota bacterium]
MIEPACNADLDDLVQLMIAFRDHLGQSQPSAAEFRASLEILLKDPDTEFLVARNADGIPLGYAQVRYRYSAWIPGLGAEIEDLFVLPLARRQGMGLELAESVTGRARQRSCRVIGLNTNERNEAALSLYQRLGFTAERASWNGSRQLWLEKCIEPA